MENRNGLLVDFQVTAATGTAERDLVPELLDQAKERHFRPQTVGLDQSYDTRECVAAIRAQGVTPHVAQNTSGRRSAIDGRTTRHAGYAVSQPFRHANPSPPEPDGTRTSDRPGRHDLPPDAHGLPL